MILIFYFSHSRLVEHIHRLCLRIFKNLSELLFEHGTPLAELIVEELLEYLIRIHHGLLALVFAYIAPTRFNAGYGTCIDGVNIGLGQVEQHLTVKWPVV